MRRARFLMGSAVIFALVPAGVAWCADSLAAASASTDSLEVAMEEHANFFGEGELVILNDGQIDLHELKVFEAESGTKYRTTEHPIWFNIRNLEGVTLVQADGKVFLDRNSERLEAMAAKKPISSLSVTPFAEREDGLMAVLSLEGDIRLEFGDAGGVSLAVLESGTDSVIFEVKGKDLAELNPELAKGGSCSATCSGGSCTNVCTRFKIPECYCDGGTPVCKCVNKITVFSLD